MKNPLNKVAIPAKLLGLTHNIFDMVCLTEIDGNLSFAEKQFVKAHGPYPSYSASKSTVALAMGLLYDKGLLAPENKISEYLSEYFPKDVDPAWYDVTIDDLLHHKSGTAFQTGFDAGEGDLDCGSRPWQQEDLLPTYFGAKMITKPGTIFRYSDENYYILARMVEKLCGKDVLLFLAENLFTKMDMKGYAWLRDPNGHIMGGTGLMMHTKDFAKLGWLWLHKGTYNGVRYISEDWMTKGIAASVSRENDAHYGYGVRRLSENVHSITGACGQGIFFNKNKNVVYAWHARKRNDVMTLCEVLDTLNVIK